MGDTRGIGIGLGGVGGQPEGISKLLEPFMSGRSTCCELRPISEGPMYTNSDGHGH
jgi:hypothetical protein